MTNNEIKIYANKRLLELTSTMNRVGAVNQIIKELHDKGVDITVGGVKIYSVNVDDGIFNFYIGG
jgi:hypothetical protein